MGGGATFLPDDFVIVPSALAMNAQIYKRQKAAKNKDKSLQRQQKHQSLDQSTDLLLQDSAQAAIMQQFGAQNFDDSSNTPRFDGKLD